MRLLVQWNGQPVESCQWVVVGHRDVCDLDLELTGNLDKGLNPHEFAVETYLDGQRLQHTVTKPEKVPPGVSWACTISVRPLASPEWQPRELKVVLQKRAAAERLDDEDTTPIASFQLSIIPATQARWSRRALYLFAVLSALIAWPILEVKASGATSYAVHAVFGSFPLLLVFDKIRKYVNKVRVADGSDGGSSLPGQGLMGLKPLFFRHLAIGVFLTSITIVLVACTIVTFHNQTEHALPMSWASVTSEPFEPKATYTLVLSGSPKDFFHRALPEGDADGYCLSPLESCPGAREVVGDDSRISSLFRLARRVDVHCRRQRWFGIGHEALKLDELEDADRYGSDVYVRAKGEDCSAPKARAVVDGAVLLGGKELKWIQDYAVRLAFVGDFQNLSLGQETLRDSELEIKPLLAGPKFLSIQAAWLPGRLKNAPVQLRSTGEADGFLEASVIVAASDKEDQKPDAPLVTSAVRVPANAGAHRFSIEIGPTNSSSWGTLTCYPRGNTNVVVWFLALVDSVVTRFQLSSAGGEVLSVWTSALGAGAAAGEPSPVLPVCIPYQGVASPDALVAEPKEKSGYVAEAVVPAVGNVSEPPQLTLPKALSAMSLRVIAESGPKDLARVVGTLNCMGSETTGVTRLRALGADVDAVVFASTAGNDNDCRAYAAKADRISSWTGRGTPLGCISKQEGCRPVKMTPGSSAGFLCAYRFGKKEMCAPAPAKEGCTLNRSGQRISSCPCKKYMRARGILSNGSLNEAKVMYGCDANTARVCECDAANPE